MRLNRLLAGAAPKIVRSIQEWSEQRRLQSLEQTLASLKQDLRTIQIEKAKTVRFPTLPEKYSELYAQLGKMQNLINTKIYLCESRRDDSLRRLQELQIQRLEEDLLPPKIKGKHELP